MAKVSMNLVVIITAAFLQASSALNVARAIRNMLDSSLQNNSKQSQGTWQYQGWWDTFRPLYVPQSKDAAKKLKRSHMMNLRIRDKVCIGRGNGLPTGNMTDLTEQMAVEGLLGMKAVPDGYLGPVVPGVVVILTVHHYGSYIWENIGHVSEAVFPIFDTLSQLQTRGLIPEMPVKGVLFHQAEKNSPTFLKTDWYTNVIKLLGKDPNNTHIFFNEDLVDTRKHNQGSHVIHKPICAQHVVILDRKALHGISPRRVFFSDTRNAFRLKEKAFIALGLPSRILHRPPGRVASMIVRSDSQGIANQEEINMALDSYLRDRCWSLRVVPPFSDPMHLKDQVKVFARTDLSISVHGAQLTNLVWQPIGSGVLIIQKCGFTDHDLSALAGQSGIAVYRSRQDSCKKQGMFRQPQLPKGKPIEAIDEPYSPVFNTDLKPPLDEALTDMESGYYRGPQCGKKRASSILGLK